MPRRSRPSVFSRRHALWAVLSLFALAQSACANTDRSSLNPNSPQAGDISQLWWVLLGVGTAVWLAVVVALLIAVFRRRSRVDTRRHSQDPIGFVLLGGAVIPVFVLVGTLVFSLRTLDVTVAQHEASVVVDVTGYRWWWEAKYPNDGVTTANEIHIPVDEQVLLRLNGGDVIHSFWVPQLQGKKDLIPGQTNELYLKADKAGTYEGVCAEYCGTQHANMRFKVIAEDRPTYDAWITAQKKPAAQPVLNNQIQGQQVFFGSACVYCHTIQGTTSSGTLGPDLTHLASRETIASGTVPLTPGSLGGWVIDPQTVKPGNLMPPTQMSGPDLQALLAYLMSLK